MNKTTQLPRTHDGEMVIPGRMYWRREQPEARVVCIVAIGYEFGRWWADGHEGARYSPSDDLYGTAEAAEIATAAWVNANMKATKESTMIKIRRRHTDQVICSGETVVKAVRDNRADLRDADLADICLKGVNLEGANLRGACLKGTDLRNADLRNANLGNANLENADLRNADLRSVCFRGADLRNTKFEGARLSWQSRTLIAEIVFRAAGDSIPKAKVAGYILINKGSCWVDSLLLEDPLIDWVLGVLAKWVQGGDNVPLCLKLKAEVQP